MSIRKLLSAILMSAVLQLGALAGLKMTSDEIEKLMNLMHKTKVEFVVKKEDKP